MVLANDTRGWILTAISGLACVAGACVICVDVFVRQFPGMRDFKIAESDAFLSASLSLSSGVILFSSLYSMLPSSKTYLNNGGYSPRVASFMLIGLFLAGVLGIRVLSQIMHKFIPSHIVDCDHTHDEETDKSQYEEVADDGDTETTEHEDQIPTKTSTSQEGIGETTPLLPQSTRAPQPQRTTTAPTGSVSVASQTNGFVTAPNSRRTSMNFTRTLSRTFSRYVSSRKDECDENGPCMGFSDPCGQDCFKIVQRRGTVKSTHSHGHHKAPTWQRIPSEYRFGNPVPEEESRESGTHTGEHSPHEERQTGRSSESHPPKDGPRSHSATHHYHHPVQEHRQHRPRLSHSHSHASHGHSNTKDHHHHVPTNAFLSIGLQTSIAIALHKAPEGFITFATNHANPKLGFSVFIALFIHNITEGFALALPLFLAFNSRFKAIVWAAVLGGLSQPLGAGVAALWLSLSAKSGQFAPGEKVYGGLFAVTAGVMASVALSLISESLQLSHNKNTCIAFAFVGMGLLGVSTALNAS